MESSYLPFIFMQKPCNYFYEYCRADILALNSVPEQCGTVLISNHSEEILIVHLYSSQILQAYWAEAKCMDCEHNYILIIRKVFSHCFLLIKILKPLALTFL